MSKRIEEIFDRLFAEIKAGISIDDCLHEYPDHAEELRPLLQLAERVAGLPLPEPDAAAVQAAIRRVRNSAVEPERFSLRRVLKLGIVPTRILAAVFFLFLFEVTTVSLSAKSLPGHLLYPVKRFAEGVQHFLTVDSEGRATIHIVLADRRTCEFACQPKIDTRVNAYLLADMQQEISSALRHLGGLSNESAARVIDQIYECHQFQMQVLESTRDTACECNIHLIEEAIKCCLEQRECIECIKQHLESQRTAPRGPGV
jgi:hypothetical protein